MTKNEMARVIVRQLYNMDFTPDASHPKVRKLARRPLRHIQDLYDAALGAEASVARATRERVQKHLATFERAADILAQSDATIKTGVPALDGVLSGGFPKNMTDGFFSQGQADGAAGRAKKDVQHNCPDALAQAYDAGYAKGTVGCETGRIQCAVPNIGERAKVQAGPLTDRLELFILRALKTAGTTDLVRSLSCVEEEMTAQEYDQALAFLRWCVKVDRTFGRANFSVVWDEWRRTDPGVRPLTPPPSAEHVALVEVTRVLRNICGRIKINDIGTFCNLQIDPQEPNNLVAQAETALEQADMALTGMTPVAQEG